MLSKFSYKKLQNRKPYIVAEIGSNHNGDINLCKRIIDSAKKNGADCIKLQTFTDKSIFSEKNYNDNYFIADDYRKRKDTNLRKIVKKYSLNNKQIKIIKTYCKRINIDFSATPFSNKEVDFLHKLNVNFIKIASMDLNNYELIKHIAKKKLPIVLSVGMGNLSEIDEAIRVIESQNNFKIIILYCVSIYPPKNSDFNLKNIITLKKNYNYPVGFSDHSIGTDLSLAAVALGACFIEKHFTFDKKMEGWDHKISSDPKELKVITSGSKNIHEALGSYRINRVENIDRIEAFRRSIVARKKIKKGQVIKKNMLDFKRPGTGLSPRNINRIIGKKIKRTIKFDEILKEEDF